MTDEKETQVEKEPDKQEDGTEFVEFADPKEKARFNRIYAHLKEYERGFQTLAKHNEQLEARLNAFELERDKTQKDAEIANLKRQLKAAKEAGETDREVEIQTNIAAVTSRPPKVVPQRTDAIITPNINLDAITHWQNEIDEDGNFLRPWARSGHPKFEEALNLTMEFQKRHGDDIEGILEAVDKEMTKGVKQSTVLSSRGGPKVKDKKLTLTENELYVAKKMGIDPEKYLKQKQLVAAERV